MLTLNVAFFMSSHILDFPITEKMQLPPPQLPFLLSLPALLSHLQCLSALPTLLCPLGPVIIRKWRKEGSQPSPSGLQRELGLRAGDPGLQEFQYLFFFPYHKTCRHTGPDAKHQGGVKSSSSCLSLVHAEICNYAFSCGTNSQGNPFVLLPLYTFMLWLLQALHSTVQGGQQ